MYVDRNKPRPLINFPSSLRINDTFFQPHSHKIMFSLWYLHTNTHTHSPFGAGMQNMNDYNTLLNALTFVVS